MKPSANENIILVHFIPHFMSPSDSSKQEDACLNAPKIGTRGSELLQEVFTS
jgi:hypothetical protein